MGEKDNAHNDCRDECLYGNLQGHDRVSKSVVTEQERQRQHYRSANQQDTARQCPNSGIVAQHAIAEFTSGECPRDYYQSLRTPCHDVGHIGGEPVKLIYEKLSCGLQQIYAKIQCKERKLPIEMPGEYETKEEQSCQGGYSPQQEVEGGQGAQHRGILPRAAGIRNR